MGGCYSSHRLNGAMLLPRCTASNLQLSARPVLEPPWTAPAVNFLALSRPLPEHVLAL